MHIYLKEIEQTGEKSIKWHMDNFNPSNANEEEAVFNEAFRVALYSYIASCFPNGFGMHTKRISDLPKNQFGRLLYCTGFRERSMPRGSDSEMRVNALPRKVFEIIVSE